ncbi:MAG: DUF2971 domain-containing protein [Acetobacteraceae bacterium]
MTNEEIAALFLPVLCELDDFDYIYEHRPQLAHYTSIGVLEKILVTEQVWLSNPLLMNDLEEMRFGLDQGMKLFSQDTDIDVCCGSPQRAKKFRQCFFGYANQFYTLHALEVYVFCLSEYDPAKPDGLLSMWRAYGNSGNGAALVFNTSLLNRRDEAPMIIAKVKYGSAESRILWLKKNRRFCSTLRNSICPMINSLCAHLFHLIKILRPSKHDGFHEERSGRSLSPHRDPMGF